MLPPSFSFHETYGKHRNPEEMRRMIQKDQELEKRAYQYGNPVKTKEQLRQEIPLVQPGVVRVRRQRLAALVLRFVSLFFS